MTYGILEQAAGIVLAFAALHIVTFCWFFATSRLSTHGRHDRLAVAVSRWNGASVGHGFVFLQIAALGAYFTLGGQA